MHAVLPERFLEGAGQFVAQTFAGHGEEVPVGLAGGRFQVLARATADVEDVALVIDEHRRRGITLQDQLIRQGLETERWFRRRLFRRPAGQGPAERRGKLAAAPAARWTPSAERASIGR